MFDGVRIKEQAYNPALAVLNLTKRYSERDLEEACEYALGKVANPRCKFIKTALASKAAQAGADGSEEEGPAGHIRGAGYYNEEGGAQ